MKACTTSVPSLPRMHFQGPSHLPDPPPFPQFKAPTGKIGDTVIANGTLLRLLKEREFVQSRRYDFEIPDFLSGSKKAYVCPSPPRAS